LDRGIFAVPFEDQAPVRLEFSSFQATLADMQLKAERPPGETDKHFGMVWRNADAQVVAAVNLLRVVQASTACSLIGKRLFSGGPGHSWRKERANHESVGGGR
jgi:hypothetical protein